MTNYRFEEAITTDDGDEAALPVLVHELYSADTRSYHPPFFRGSPHSACLVFPCNCNLSWNAASSTGSCVRCSSMCVIPLIDPHGLGLFARGSRTQSGPPASTCAPSRPFSSLNQV
jgi:hypothetical protein